MEYRIYEPINRGPRHAAVELSDLQSKEAATVTHRELQPASEELIDYMWQREAAMTALSGINANIRPGIHRMQEERRFQFDVREHIAQPLRRGLGRLATGILKLRETFAPGLRIVREPEPEYVGLQSFGFEGYTNEPSHFREVAPEPIVAIGRASVPNTPAEAVRYFSSEELTALRQTVADSRERDGIASYESLDIPAAA